MDMSVFKTVAALVAVIILESLMFSQTEIVEVDVNIWPYTIWIESEPMKVTDGKDPKTILLSYEDVVYVSTYLANEWISNASNAKDGLIISPYEKKSVDYSSNNKLEGDQILERQACLRPDVKIYMRGKSVRNDSLHPFIEFQGEIFLPINEVAFLMGKEANHVVTHISDKYTAQAVYLRKALTEEEKNSVQKYLDSAFLLCDEFSQLVGLLDKHDVNMHQTIKSCQRLLEDIKNMQKPMASPFVDYQYEEITAVVQECIKIADEICPEQGQEYQTVTVLALKINFEVIYHRICAPLYALESVLEQRGFISGVSGYA